MNITASWRLLPPDLIEIQLGQIDLLSAMYPEDVAIEESSRNMIETLRSLGDGDVAAETLEKLSSAPAVSMVLQITIPSSPADRNLELDLVISFVYTSDTPPDEPPQVRVRVRQPLWMNRAATHELMADIPEVEDLLGTIELIKEAATQQLDRPSLGAEKGNILMKSSTIVRVWFYFPSISTRSKRDDFIIHAPSYSLTGFLYAGKPGLLCVEGDSQDIDEYMKYIKTESWGDIPAHHKKVRERYRETKDVERVFPNMTETTDLVGERRGQRANRGDMKAMEEWLTERGLGKAFTKVLM